MKKLSVTSHTREEMIDITAEIQAIVNSENIKNGVVVVYVPHTTAGITINEGADPDVQHDLIITLRQLIPRDAGYLHGEGNSDAHIKASLLGSSVTILINNTSLVLGTWQHIFFYEGDGPRHRTVYVDCITR
jgi:secondary thiamine-phosphate synthase enzyme